MLSWLNRRVWTASVSMRLRASKEFIDLSSYVACDWSLPVELVAVMKPNVESGENKSKTCLSLELYSS